VYQYLAENIAPEIHREQPVELRHIAHLCHQLFLWTTKRVVLGDFLQAVVDDSLTRAIHAADYTNKTALWVYVAFLYNVAPSGWRKALKELEEET